MYTYGWNNPTKYNDKTGHNPAIIAAAEGVAFLFDLAYTSWFATHPPESIVTETPYDGESGINITITPIEQQSVSVTQTTFGNNAPTIITTPFQDQTPTVITTPFVEHAPTILQSSAGWSLSAIAGKYGNCQCAEAANDMKSYLLKNGLNGEQVSIKYDSPGFIVSNTYGTEAISQNGYHTGILYEDKVYDNIHTNGTSYQDWLNDFYGVGNRTITRTSINQGG
ncbi:papain fold toxin domain-containing protein [Paenibacillus ferrarius]|uniref:papain fold toxin domain-containing protein n=1 Tax=Paenibacillus ferrarius TaxID=1469647 RepID=UPI001301B425|nr:papain fold toxin domain-containing protein [Paenibacillus ferrarius]